MQSAASRKREGRFHNRAATLLHGRQRLIEIIDSDDGQRRARRFGNIALKSEVNVSCHRA